MKDLMTEVAVTEKMVNEVGGVFKLTVLMQRRVRELVKGATPLVAVSEEMTPIDIAMREYLEGKINYTEIQEKKKEKAKKK